MLIIKVKIMYEFKFTTPISEILGIEYVDTDRQDRVLLRHAYIKELEEKDPDKTIIVWDYLEYTSGKIKRSGCKAKTWWSKNVLISNHGFLAYFKNDGTLVVTPGYNARGYRKVTLSKLDNHQDVYLHRAVASTYIPCEGVTESVNHKNGKKSQNNIKNLEWGTEESNSEHAVKTGLVPSYSFMATCILDDENQGKTFKIKTGKTLDKYGLYGSGPSYSLKHNAPVYGCLWKEIEKSDEEYPPPPDWFLKVARDQSYTRGQPILVTILKGEYKDETFSLFGDKEKIKNGFKPQSIRYWLSIGGVSPDGRFKITSVSRLEANRHPRGARPDLLNWINS